MHKTFDLTGMHCQSCVGRLTDALTKVPGVHEATVTLNPQRARLSGPDIDTSKVREAVASAGDYTAKESSGEVSAAAVEPESATTYYPLFLIVAFLIVGAALLQLRQPAWSWLGYMSDFMAGFFLVFGFFKLLDVRGFVDAFQMYDVVAAKSRAYAYVYPFIEIGLGIAYLIRFELFWISVITMVVMVLGSVGVLRSVLNKRKIKCACLGTVFNLPMSTVTLVEDLGMAAMAGAMIVMRLM